VRSFGSRRAWFDGSERLTAASSGQPGGRRGDRSGHVGPESLNRGLLALDERTQLVTTITASGVVVTIGGCLDWVMTQGRPPGVSACRRLTVIRGFARYLQSLDPVHQVPAVRLIRQPTHRPTPRLYTDDEIGALMTAARTLDPSGWAVTVETMIGLLWATGIRAGELLRLNVADFDPAAGELTIRLAKFNKTRLVPLEPTTTKALAAYHGAAAAQAANGLRGLGIDMPVVDDESAWTLIRQQTVEALTAIREDFHAHVA
jgi:integrase